MAILTANGSGVVTGHFTVPANVPVGAKLVEFTGSGGSSGSAVFVGSNSLERRTQQQVIQQGTFGLWAGTRRSGSDPLAQTFMVTQDSQFSGVDLWFTAKGSSEVVVSIRGTQVGFPTQQVFAEVRVPAASILTNGSPTRIVFPNMPMLRANTEYALVVMTDDAVTAVAVAQLGQWDTTNGKWITSQPYQVGALLSSSNASTWTAHQDMDLTFRLLRPAYTQTSRTLDLGTTAVEDASDLMVMADVDLPSSAANCVFRLTLIDNANEAVLLAPYQPVSLASRYTGDVKVEAILTGTATASPVLYPNVQLAVGNLAETGTYITREFSANSGTNLVVTYEAITPGASTVVVEVHNGTTWSTVAYDSGAPVEDNWVEFTHVKANFSGPTARLRITLTGTAALRPVVRNLRAILT